MTCTGSKHYQTYFWGAKTPLLHLSNPPRIFYSQIPSALCTIYNFIKINHPNKEELPKSINSEYSSPIPDPGDDTVRQMQSMENDEIEDIKIRRDRIAQDMWEDFQKMAKIQIEYYHAKVLSNSSIF